MSYSELQQQAGPFFNVPLRKLFLFTHLATVTLRALEVPLYQLFYDGEEPPKLPNLPKRKSSEDIAWGSSGKDGRYLNKLRRLLAKTEEADRKLLLHMAQKMARPRNGRAASN